MHNLECINLPFCNKVHNFIKEYQLISPDESFIIAFSGGIDSTACVFLLHHINVHFKLNWKIYLIYINHHLREEETKKEERFIANIAHTLSLPFTISDITLEKNQKEEYTSLEAFARKKRYEVLYEYAENIGIKKIVTAHTQDDNIETFLMRLITGAGPYGLQGIKPKRVLFKNKRPEIFVVRPLLSTSRKEILDFLQSLKVSPCLDSSNKDKKYLRNKIRLILIPFLNTHSPHLLPMLHSLSQKYTLFINAIEKQFSSLFESITYEQEKIYIPLEILKQYHAIFKKFLLNYIINNSGIQIRMKSIHYDDLIKLVEKKGSSHFIHLPNKYIANLVYDKIIIQPFESFLHPEGKEFLYVLKSLTVSNPYISLQKYSIDDFNIKDFIKKKSTKEEIFDMEKIKFPLIVRYRTRYDTFFPLGYKKECKLKKFFINEKIPVGVRNRIPLIVDASGRVMWVVGYRNSEHFKITSATRWILKLIYKK